ncbi:MAG: peptidase M10 [Flavisolibacter sp.]
MGSVEISEGSIIIRSHIITYGQAATQELTEQIRSEIDFMWNEPEAIVRVDDTDLPVKFIITAEYRPDLSEMEVIQNTDPKNNYFRIENFSNEHISFVDGLGCNTGYFKIDNLLPGWTTAAHEYGHTLGLSHPRHLDIRGQGVPGIMYPRGTLVDPSYQYDPTIPAGQRGGTMHPMHRKVRQADIDALRLDRIVKEESMKIVGAFTNVYHWDHGESMGGFSGAPVAG